MRLLIVMLIVASGWTARVHAEEAAPKSRERVLCEHMTSAAQSVLGDSGSLSSMLVIDEIRCFQQSGPDAGKYCTFRREYQRTYLLKDSAGAEFYDALVDYYGDEISQDQPIALEGMMVIGKLACEAMTRPQL